MRFNFAVSVLIVAAIGSAVMMWSGVRDGSFSATAWSAASFVAVAVLVALLRNKEHWGTGIATVSAASRQLNAMRENAQLCAIVYAWGAVAMVAMYKLTGLYWQHGLQYACGMLLLGAVMYGWSRRARPETPDAAQRAAQLNALHGGVAAVAVAIFLFSGKFWVPRPDWAANIVFLSGAFAIVSLSAIAAISHWRIGRGA